MAKIMNLGRFPMTLQTGHVIPGNGEIEVDNSVIRSIDNQRSFPALKATGEIDWVFDEEPAEREAKPSFEANSVSSQQDDPVDVQRDPLPEQPPTEVPQEETKTETDVQGTLVLGNQT